MGTVRLDLWGETHLLQTVLNLEETRDKNRMVIRIERVTRTNLSLLRDINQKIFPILTMTDDNLFNQYIDNEIGFAYLAYWNDLLAGAVCCQLTDNNGLYLRFIGTLNRHRRRGVAKKLMQRVMKDAQERDIHNVYTYVRNDNKAAIHVNHKFGLGVTGSDREDSNILLMERMLHTQ